MSSYVNWCDVICFIEPTTYRAQDKRPLRADKVKPEKLNLILSLSLKTSWPVCACLANDMFHIVSPIL